MSQTYERKCKEFSKVFQKIIDVLQKNEHELQNKDDEEVQKKGMELVVEVCKNNNYDIESFFNDIVTFSIETTVSKQVDQFMDLMPLKKDDAKSLQENIKLERQASKNNHVVKPKTNGNGPICEKPTTIVVMGQTSCGKSSLINKLIGKRVCPTAVMRNTAIIAILKWTEKMKQKPKELCKILESANEEQSLSHIELEAFDDKSLKNLRIIDTPGLGDDALDGTFDKIKPYITTADLVFYLVSPNRLTDTLTIHYLNRLTEVTCRVMVVITMIDKVCHKNDDSDSDDDDDRVELLRQREFRKLMFTFSDVFKKYGLPFIPTSTKKKFNIQLEYLYDAVQKYAHPSKNSYAYIRNAVYKALTSNWMNNPIPLSIWDEYLKNKKNKKVGITIIGGVLLGLIAGGIGAIGTLLYVILPSLGTGAGAALITSGLATLGMGYGMVGGITVAAIGTTVFAALGAGLVGTLASTAGGRITMALISDQSMDIPVNVCEMNEDVWNTLMTYYKDASGDYDESLIPSRWEKEYEDSVVVKVEDKWYIAKGTFKRKRMVFLLEFNEIKLKK